MRKRSCGWDNDALRISDCRLRIGIASSIRNSQSAIRHSVGLCVFGLSLSAGCATPSYAVRPTPVPVESSDVVRIERAISAQQAQRFERSGARPLGLGESPHGFPVQQILDRLRQVSERPGLPYRAHLYEDDNPNAAALADGRVYVSTGMLAYLASRGGSPDELASVLAHELAHTVAQHLVKRYQLIQQQQLLLAVVSAGAAAATRGASAGVAQAGQLATNVAGLLSDVATSGYSQDQELEADQLGIRYVIRAGYDPTAAPRLLRDFARFDVPWPFLRTHPYSTRRVEDLERYRRESGETPPPALPQSPSPPSPAMEDRLRHLQEIQRGYPSGSVSWENLQRQIDALIGDSH